jgi:DNA repair protein RecN (Recombination protein N)
MLQQIDIRNYAIIDSISISFSKQLNIITGETGAGKSILMGALSLILGDRADSAMLLDRDKKCIIEGTFLVKPKSSVAKFLAEQDLDADGELVIRREIAATGKSRAFVNDTPVTLAQLQQLSTKLVDLHRQFDTLELGETDFQRNVLDALAGSANNLVQYQSAYKLWQQSKRTLQTLTASKDQFTKDYDYNQFLFNELDELSLKENELENLEAELQVLSNAEGIKTALTKASYELNDGEQPLVQQLRLIEQQLSSFTAYHHPLATLVERLHSTQVELQDIADEIETVNSKVNYDPAAIERINERMTVGYKLLKKHNVKDTAALLEIQRQLEEKLQAVLNIDDAIAKAKAEEEAQLAAATAIAGKLSKQREAAIAPFEKEVNKLLTQVGMPNARLKVSVARSSDLNAFGNDDIEFLFDANKTNRFEPIRKVASGGELSRLMLCIKSLVGASIELPTMIFDEIDTGISGEAARQVGIIMKRMADNLQVICITHQPQIAGKADMHFYVYKRVEGNHVKTSIRELSNDERITIIAQMLSGEKPTAAALENAREMLAN